VVKALGADIIQGAPAGSGTLNTVPFRTPYRMAMLGIPPLLRNDILFPGRSIIEKYNRLTTA
jgi:hypothetical protein